MVGKTLGHYEILEPLGKGGMGEVYRARDTKLDRDVAIKVLPEDFAADPDRLARFEREAKAVAALDHPNIVTVHSVEQAEGHHFITMQLVEGRTLSELLPRGGFSVEKLFQMVVPLAEAVSVAHQQGITHRDLKPANIMVSADGRVRILDFGLAKLSEETSAPDAATQLDTERAIDLTEEGKVLGTVAYMSPEQAEGKQVDPRSDVFSLGILIYEMATGERPFKGDTKVSVISSVVKDLPNSITDLNSNLPRHLGRIVNKCLEKDPSRRYQSALGLRNDLDELATEVASGEALPVHPSPIRDATKNPAMYAALVSALVVGVIGGYYLLRLAQPAGLESETWTTTQLTNLPGAELDPSISPDGDFVVYSGDAEGDFDIYRKRVGGGNAFNLTPNSPDQDTQPAFSPDGAFIAFRSGRDGGGIFVMGATGENVRQLSDRGFNAAWSPDSRRIVFSTQDLTNPDDFGGGRELWTTSVETGESRFLHSGVMPHWSPNGFRIAYFDAHEGGQRDIWTIASDGGDPVPVTNSSSLDWNPVWSTEGEWLYFASDQGGSRNIWRVAIDEESGEVLGDPEQISTSDSWQGFITVSQDGSRIAYVSDSSRSNIRRVRFNPVSGVISTDSEEITRGSRRIWHFDLSSDGQWIVHSVTGREDLFRMRTDGTDSNRITNDYNNDRRPKWSPDGSEIAFYSDREGEYGIWIVDRNGGRFRRATTLLAEDGGVWDPFWSPDGWLLGYYMQGIGTFLVDPRVEYEQQTPTHLPPASGEGVFRGYAWAPGGTLIAGLISGRISVYSLETQEYTEFDQRGFGPIWLGDDAHLLFRGQRGSKILLLNIRTGDTTELLDLAPRFAGSTLSYDQDEGWIYFVEVGFENDIYLLTRSAPQ